MNGVAPAGTTFALPQKCAPNAEQPRPSHNRATCQAVPDPDRWRIVTSFGLSILVTFPIGALQVWPSMKNLFALVIVHMWVGMCLANGPSLPRSTPEEQGISSAGILDFITAADAKIQYMHGFMLVRHGHVVAEGWWAPYSAESRHALFSLSKSFTSTAVGLAVNEGKLNVDDEVIKFFPDDLPAKPSANLKAMRVRDLLTMS